ncbi:META domain-containing protein [Nocardioides sp. GCM10028917]|jgi:heat shock protein HslJ|uniref:META domain-containing protein n=1 Tax=Nocardioides sp. GCM10028917 TaxID=3273408 RepID=UPI0036202768
MGGRGAAAALLVVTLTAACADSSDSSSSPSPSTTDASTSTLDPAALDGRSYASTSVEGAELAEGTTIEVGFDGDTMSVWTGCNTAFGPFEVDGTTLAWTSEPAATMMMCDPDFLEQDRWLTDLFRSGVDATVEGDALTLQADGVTIELETDTSDDLDSLLGRTWTAIGTVSDGAVSRLPVDTRRPRLDVGADGLSRLFTGCRSGRVTVQVEDQALVFSNVTLQRGRCTGPAGQTERAVLALLDGASDNAELHDHLLVVTRGGEGLFFEVR